MPYIPIFLFALIYAAAMLAWDLPWLVGGWPGGLLAQQWLRHKTSKRSFQQMFWVTVVANVAGFLWLSSRLAAS